MKKFLLLALIVFGFFAFAGAATACPTCENFSLWKGQPCIPGNCSPCGFCAYCCDRLGIGCEYCNPALADVSSGCEDDATATIAAEPSIAAPHATQQPEPGEVPATEQTGAEPAPAVPAVVAEGEAG